MLKLIAQIETQAGKESLVAEQLRRLVPPSRAEEGCVSYTPYQSTESATVFFVVEDWKSKEALETHTQTPHFRAFLEAVGDAMAGPPTMHFVEEL